jgi:hypothetical protein
LSFWFISKQDGKEGSRVPGFKSQITKPDKPELTVKNRLMVMEALLRHLLIIPLKIDPPASGPQSLQIGKRRPSTNQYSFENNQSLENRENSSIELL